jgi:soluble lytic murein transglycosylase-like protein
MSVAAAALALAFPRVLAVPAPLPFAAPAEPAFETPRAVPKPRSAAAADARYAELIDAAAALYQVSARLIRAVITVESNYRADAVSPVGAAGLMQLMPDTAARYGVADPFDPAANIDAGVRHLAMLLARFGNDLTLTLAAYNAGEGAVLRYNGVPPYPETRRYVEKVLEHYRRPAQYAAGALPSRPPAE